MTERDLYFHCIPVIAEIAVKCCKLPKGEYEEWKQEIMVHAPETVKGFIGKVFIIIDNYVLERKRVKRGEKNMNDLIEKM